jgi:flagellar secretion chaperone FliS
MMNQSATQSYRQTNVLSADQSKLIRLCYEGAIGSLKLARDAYIGRDYAAKGKALTKTIDIIHELNASLDMARGGDIAKNLRALYLFITQALIEADLHKNLKVFDNIINMLEELESAWREIAQGRSVNVGHPTFQPMPNNTEQAVAVNRLWSA